MNAKRDGDAVKAAVAIRNNFPAFMAKISWRPKREMTKSGGMVHDNPNEAQTVDPGRGGRGQVTGEGFKFQISLGYCLFGRSVEDLPEDATLLLAVPDPLSRYA